MNVNKMRPYCKVLLFKKK